MRVVDVKAGYAHCQIVIGDTVTLVDVGDAERVLAALEGEGLDPRDVRRIVLTHGDGDHWQGAMAIRRSTGAELLAHEAERPYLTGTATPPFSLPKRVLIRFGSRRGGRPEIDRWLLGGEHLDGLEVVHAPGHTPGSLCLYAGAVLIAGDAFTTGDRFREVPRLMTSDLGRSRETIRTLARRDITRAFSGHGEPSDDAGAKLRALAASLSA